MISYESSFLSSNNPISQRIEMIADESSLMDPPPTWSVKGLNWTVPAFFINADVHMMAFWIQRLETKDT